MRKDFIKILLLASEYKYWMLLAALMGFFTVGSGIGLMLTSSYLIAKAALQTPIYQLQVAIVGVRFFGIARGVFRYFERYISHEVTFKLLAKFRLWFFESLAPLVPSKTVDYTSGDLLTRAIEDIESLEHIFVRVISPPFVLVAVSVLMFALLNIFNITYALVFVIIFFATSLGIPILTFLMSNKLGQKIVQLKSELEKRTIDNLKGLPEIIVYNQREKWEKEILNIQSQIVNAEYKMNLIQSLHESLTGLAMNFTVAVMLFIAIQDVSKGALEGVYLSVITIGIMASFEIVFQIPLAFQYLNKSIEAGKRLFEITDVKSDEINDNKATQNLKDFNLSIKNISFSYDGKRKTLSNISFELKENQSIAIVGASGSGKSTLVNLLTRLWNYDEGDILLGNISYNNLSPQQIRNVISVIPQKVHLFTGTIRENLFLANSNATEEEMYSVIKQVDLMNLIENFPNKLDTHIGEFGKKLSGGESKRLLMARALLRNTPIIIFDEINSHIDYLTERKILQTVKDISKLKRIIFITHRIVQMEIFDEILVLSNGNIVERGKHNELLQRGNFYKQLAEAQLTQI